MSFSCGSTATTTKMINGKSVVVDKNGEPVESRSLGKASDPSALQSGPEGSEVISMIYFSPNQKLYLGSQSGHLVEVDVDAQRSKVNRVAQKNGIVATSPDGNFVVINADSPAVMGVDGSLVLQMGMVKQFEAAVFSGDAKTLYVGERTGKLRIWGQSHSFEKQGKGERLENYLNRQAPDFLVTFASIEGPIASSGRGMLFVADSEGIISAWDPSKPGEIHRLMKVKGTVKSMQATAQHVVTTSKSGFLKVGRVDPPSYFPWSKDVRAEFAAISEFTGDDFVFLDAQGVKMKSIEEGKEKWALDLPEGPRCGLDVSDDGRTIAACIGNMVYLISGSGNLLSQIYIKKELVWIK